MVNSFHSVTKERLRVIRLTLSRKAQTLSREVTDPRDSDLELMSSDLGRVSAGDRLTRKERKMKQLIKHSRRLLIVTLVFLPLTLSANGQSSGDGFQISQSVIANGGGKSSAGSFAIEGTAGQSTLGPKQVNSPFTLTSGFWFESTPSAPTASPSSISGRVTTSEGFPLAGALILLRGNRQAGTVTDSNGAYRFDDLDSDGFYTVTPSLANYQFSPSSLSFSLMANRTDANFLALANTVGTQNPIEVSEYFVRQQYLDFLNRDADLGGLAFWVNEIEVCGAELACRELKRVNVSAAFFLSTEFQETGFMVYRMHDAAFGTAERLRLNDFVRDTQEIGRNVVVGQAGWQQQLSSNRRAFVDSFVLRPEFVIAFPLSMSPEEFVDRLNANTGGVLTTVQRDILVRTLAAHPGLRGEILRTVAANQEYSRRTTNRAFVLMQYFAYLRRAPNDPPDNDFSGFQFWLNKLELFEGNFVAAEMVKAFITSGEYQLRFGR